MNRRTDPLPLRALLVAVLGATLVLSGCGSDESEEAKASISDFLMQKQSEEQMIKLNRDEADCMSADMVDGIGVDKLKDYGFLNEDGTVDGTAKPTSMDRKDAETMVDAMFHCTDVMATMNKELAASMGQQSEETKKCFEKALTEDAVREMLTATFAGEQEAASKELTGSLMKCALGGASATPK